MRALQHAARCVCAAGAVAVAAPPLGRPWPHPARLPLPPPQGFFGCKHFSQANQLLEQSGMPPIDWQIESISAEAKAAAVQQHQAALAAAGVAK